MSVATIRAAVKSLLEGITGIGVVNDIETLNTDPDEFLDKYVQATTGAIHGWVIVLREMPPGWHFGMVDRRYEIVLKGVYGVENASRSREAADNLLEDIVDTFAKTAANRRLNNTVAFTEIASTEVREDRVRGSEGRVPCHRITVVIQATQEEATT